MPLTCLIVDDEAGIRAYLKTLLQLEDIRPLEAENAPQAFRLLQKLNDTVDLVVTDVQMPGDMDGLDLAYAVRNAFPSIPVLLISGYACADRAPIRDFELIVKPFKPDVFLSAVKRTASSAKNQLTSEGPFESRQKVTLPSVS